MTPLFPFRRSTPAVAPAVNPMAITPMAVTFSGGAPSLDIVLNTLLGVLQSHIPSAGGSLPAAGVSAISVQERTLGLGNYRGTERRGNFAAVALMGGRLAGTARFELWGDTPGAVDTRVNQLQGALLAARDALWTAGFLKLAAAGAISAEHLQPPNAWRRSVDYTFLYEYHYQDSDGAESLLARIPIHSDLEERDSLVRETSVVTDRMVRWDDEAAPVLEFAASSSAGLRISGLASLATLPVGWTGHPVTLARLSRSAPAAPTTYPDLATFLAAVSDSVTPDRHAQVSFPNVAAFLAVFSNAGASLELGDWDEDGTPDLYEPKTLAFAPPLRLDTADDLFRLSYQDAVLDDKAVVYLRTSGFRL
jgi:hypothetical protein